MAKNVGSILLLTFVILFARADEYERRRNTPPELTPESTPESVVKISSSDEEPQTRLLSFPVTATVSLNAGHNNAHFVSLDANFDGISLSESNSYSHPTRYGIGSPVSVSKSATVAAGLLGISTAGAKAYSDGSNTKTKGHSLSFGPQATATSFGIVENGRAITSAASSVGSSQSSVATNNNRGQFFSQTGAVNTQYPYRPTWNNVGPSNVRCNDQSFNRPMLTIWKPYDGTRPTLNIDAFGTARREEKPTIHIYKWQPSNDHRIFSRPSLMIGHQPRDSWNEQTRGSTNFQ